MPKQLGVWHVSEGWGGGGGGAPPPPTGMDQTTIKTPIPNCRLYWCLIELETGDRVSHVGIFLPSCELAPLYLLSSSLPPPPFRTYKIALPSLKKTWEGRGPKTDKHMPPSPFTGQFLRKAGVWCLSSYLVHGHCDLLVWGTNEAISL